MLSNNSCRGFCITEAQWGDPLSFTGKYYDGFPEVEKYNGSNFCGITNETVVNIDATIQPLGTMVAIGGVVNICRTGTFRIRKLLFKNPEDIEFNKYIKPTKNGWKVQQERTKKTCGFIEAITESAVDVRLY